jgi:predicted small integral membrane protein
MTSARNTRVSFAKNAVIIIHALKTIKYIVVVNNLSQYNQYFYFTTISLKIETIIIPINYHNSHTQWLLFTDN